MKITKSQLRKLIKEEVAAVPVENLVSGISGLVDGIDPEEVSELFTQVFRKLPGVEIQMHDTPDEPETSSRQMIGFNRGKEKESEMSDREIGFRENLYKIIREELEKTLEESEWQRNIDADRECAAKHKRNSPEYNKCLSDKGIDENLDEEKDWIQKAVDPDHEGYCTPMTKSTCTPRRKALAKRFKKAARKKETKGGTGWQGKV